MHARVCMRTQVLKVLLPNGNGRDVVPMGTGRRVDPELGPRLSLNRQDCGCTGPMCGRQACSKVQGGLRVPFRGPSKSCGSTSSRRRGKR